MERVHPDRVRCSNGGGCGPVRSNKWTEVWWIEKVSRKRRVETKKLWQNGETPMHHGGSGSASNYTRQLSVHHAVCPSGVLYITAEKDASEIVGVFSTSILSRDSL